MEGGDEVSVEQLSSNLSTYQEQLLQVRNLLLDDPSNMEYADMEKELVEVIALTEELLTTAKHTGFSGSIHEKYGEGHIHGSSSPNMDKNTDVFPLGTKVQAVWSEDGEWPLLLISNRVTCLQSFA